MLSSRAKFWAAFLAIVGATAAGTYLFVPGGDSEDIVAPARQQESSSANVASEAQATAASPLTWPRLHQAAEADAAPKPLFETKSWYVPPPPPPPPKPAPRPAPPPPPQAPPLPYRFMGWMDDGDRLRAFLSKGESVYAVAEGEQLDGSYRVERVEPTRITFLYVPLSQTQTLALSGGSGAPPMRIPEAATAAVAAPEAAQASAGRAPVGSATATAAEAAAGTPATLSPQAIDPAAMAQRLRQQHMLDRVRNSRSLRQK